VTRLLASTVALWAILAVGLRADFTPAPSFSSPHPAVVRVVVPERDGASYGSGSLVAVSESSGLIVTNWHVVRDAAGRIVVYFPDGFHSGAALLRVDRDWDLAALAIWRPNVKPVAISAQAPQPGDALTIAGYGSGSYRAVTGQCTQYVSPGGNQPFEMIELAAPARNGDSGGPILNGRGELAGVLFGSAFGRTTGSYCVRLRWFLNSVDGDFQRISSQAMLAQQSHGNSPPVAAISAVNPAVATDASLQPNRLSSVPATWPPPSSAAVAVP
jgi:S1-C subfamily serine protease